MSIALPKLGVLDSNGESVAHDYGDIYFRQPCGDGERLVIGPTRSQIKLLDELAAEFDVQRFYALYVLLLTHTGRSPGRYQSPLIHGHEELQLLIWTFQSFFEGDGRHHLWIASPDSPDVLVYDQHDVIFAYGNLEAYELVLKRHNFAETEFWFPSPHVHGFDPTNGNVEDELMSFFEWKHFELQPGDDWD